jgi:hypothetical protein
MSPDAPAPYRDEREVLTMTSRLEQIQVRCSCGEPYETTYRTSLDRE